MADLTSSERELIGTARRSGPPLTYDQQTALLHYVEHLEDRVSTYKARFGHVRRAAREFAVTVNSLRDGGAPVNDPKPSVVTGLRQGERRIAWMTSLVVEDTGLMFIRLVPSGFGKEVHTIDLESASLDFDGEGNIIGVTCQWYGMPEIHGVVDAPSEDEDGRFAEDRHALLEAIQEATHLDLTPPAKKRLRAFIEELQGKELPE